MTTITYYKSSLTFHFFPAIRPVRGPLRAGSGPAEAASGAREATRPAQRPRHARRRLPDIPLRARHWVLMRSRASQTWHVR